MRMLWLNYVLTTATFGYTFYRLKYDEKSINTYHSHDQLIESTTSSIQSTFKQQKEHFVSGHTGTTPFELVILCSVSPIGVFLYLQCHSILFESSRRVFLYNRLALIVEYIMILLPMVWSQSYLFFPWGISILFGQLLFAQFLISFRRKKENQSRQPWSKSSETRFIQSPTLSPKPTMESKSHHLRYHLPLLACYRASVLFMTFIAILAVDFQIFPRRYAKTETRGYGLMDLGTGSFIFSSGLVSSFAKGTTHGSRSSSSSSYSKTTRLTMLRRCIPLILLGFIRLLSHKGLEYPEHATEYGVHWNFFFTLVLVLNSAYCLRSIFKIRATSFPFVLLFIYQYFLSHGGQIFVEQAPRFSTTYETRTIIYWCYNLYLANREGMLGCIGYLSLYLISEHIGSFCLWDYEQIGYPLEARFLSVSTILWTLHWFFTTILHIPVSRRSTNASYIVWSMAQNTLQLFFFSTVFSIANCNGSKIQHQTNDSPEIKTPCPPIFESMNRHGLLIFVIANLLTGFINLTVNTMTCSVNKSFAIMTIYSITLAIISLVMDWIHPIVDNH